MSSMREETGLPLRLYLMFTKTSLNLQLLKRLQRRRRTRLEETDMLKSSMPSMSRKWANSWILLLRITMKKNRLNRIKRKVGLQSSKMTRTEKMTLRRKRMTTEITTTILR